MMRKMKSKNREFEQSQIRTSLAMFLESYNQSIPKGFPRASVAALEKFKILYPALFKHGNTWSIAQHRKRFIDWHSLNRSIS